MEAEEEAVYWEQKVHCRPMLHWSDFVVQEEPAFSSRAGQQLQAEVVARSLTVPPLHLEQSP